MAILHKNISAEGDIHNPKWFSGANNGDVPWRNELGVLESTDELVLPAALDFVDGSATPPTSNSGDIYVLSSGASVNAGWGAVSLGDWVRYDGTTWNVITPQKSSLCYNEASDSLMSYTGLVWAGMGGGISSVTSAEKAALSPSVGDFVYDTDLSSLQRYNGSSWVTVANGYGVLAISNSNGEYSYYSTFADAVTASSSGDIIQLFSNITETGNVTVSIPDGVSVNLNGYTYTLDGSDNSAFSITGTSDYSLTNGTIRKINSPTPSGGGSGLNIGGGSATGINVDCNGLKVISDGLYGLNLNSSPDGSIIVSGGSYVYESTTSKTGVTHLMDGSLRNAYLNTQDGYIRLAIGKLLNSKINGAVFQFSSSSSETNNCTIYNSNNNAGLLVVNSASNCYVFSSSSDGIKINNASAFTLSCVGISNGGAGFNVSQGKAFNSYAESTSTYAVWVNGTNSYFYNGVAKSDSSYVCRLRIGGRIYDSTLICTLNSASGSGINVQTAGGFEIVNCTVEVVNSSAFAVTGNLTGIISGLKGKGMTTLIGTTTNSAGTIDTFGNGIL